MIRFRPAGRLSAWSTARTVTAAKMVLAATAAWVVAAYGLHDPIPVLAPVAALLTVQGSVYATVRQGLSVSTGVLLGAAIGLGLGHVAGNRWWVIAVATAAGLAVRELPYLRRASGTQLPVSALLVVALGQSYGYARVVDTAVGCALGVMVNMTILPPIRVDETAHTLQRAATNTADILRDAARGVGGDWARQDAVGWLRRARRLEANLEDVRDTLRSGEQSLRWNPQREHRRGLPRLRVAFTALDHATAQVRSIARGLADVASDEQRNAVAPPRLPSYDALVGCCVDATEAFARAIGGDPGAAAAARSAIESGHARADETVDAIETVHLGARRERLVAALVDEAVRLLGEVAPDGAHKRAYPG